MKEHPILFSTSMVQAILAGRKTMTRRIMKPQPEVYRVNGHGTEMIRHSTKKHYIQTHLKDAAKDFIGIPCPYGHLGDVLWVREKFRKYCVTFPDSDSIDFDHEIIEYASDPHEAIPMQDGDGFGVFNKDGSERYIPWKPSIHMPKDACRIYLEITGIRVERLQEITMDDIISEGVRYPVDAEKGSILFKLGEENSALNFMPEGFSLKNEDKTPLNEQDLLFAHWAELWCSINGRESWNSNPWVWVISFKRIEKP